MVYAPKLSKWLLPLNFYKIVTVSAKVVLIVVLESWQLNLDPVSNYLLVTKNQVGFNQRWILCRTSLYNQLLSFQLTALYISFY